MLVRLAGAQFQLEALIGELRQSTNAAGMGIAEAGLADVAALQRSVATASASGLTALRLDVGTTVAAVTASAQQVRIAAGAATAAETARALIEASVASRATVTSVMDGMHDFDSALRFTTAADAEAYRQREAARRSYIDAQQSKHTPEGDLNAASGAVGQMVDAKAHGAGDSPEFQNRWSELVATTERLRDAVRRNGGSTKEFDDRLRKDLRHILKSKGLSDAQIDAQFAAHAGDPMEAAKGYVAENDVALVRKTVESERWQTDQVTVVAAKPPASASSADDPFATLRSAGVTASDHQTTDYTHGVAASAAKPLPSRAQG